MFNLLMVGRDGYWDEREVAEMEEARFLEHTQVHIRDQFTPVNQEVLETLQMLPTLFAYEFPREARYRTADDVKARVGRLLEIRYRGRSLDFKFELSVKSSALSSEKIAELAWELDIDVKGNESHRTHWSVKPGDLPTIFRTAGLKFEKRFLIGPGQQPVREVAKAKVNPKPKVFVVHGRNDATKHEVGRWLARIGLEEVILHEQPNLGRTIINKFADVAGDASYAVVLMTPDDTGGLKDGSHSPGQGRTSSSSLATSSVALGRKRLPHLSSETLLNDRPTSTGWSTSRSTPPAAGNYHWSRSSGPWGSRSIPIKSNPSRPRGVPGKSPTPSRVHAPGRDAAPKDRSLLGLSCGLAQPRTPVDRRSDACPRS